MGQQAKKYLRAPLAFKADGPEGSVTAVFSTFGVIDKDGDVLLPGAFTPGQTVPMAWAHDWAMPVGKGTISVEPDRALFSGQFFLDTQAGQEAYKTVKAMGDLQEWSWGFQVLDSSYETRDGKPCRVIKQAKVFEVSPVLVGAGENTRTLAIKSANDAEIKTDVARDFNATRQMAVAEENLWQQRWELQDALRESVGSILGDETLDDATKIAMIRTSVAQYGEALAGWAQRALALRASGVDVELDGLSPTDHKGQPYADHAEQVLAACKEFVGRSKALAALRNQSKEGRTLSQANRDKLATLLDTLNSVAKEVGDLLVATEPPKALPLDYLERRLRASALSLAQHD